MTRCKCDDCGNIFSLDDARIEEVYESRGEFWGAPCSELMVYVYCPDCGSDDVNTEYFLSEEEEEEYASRF